MFDVAESGAVQNGAGKGARRRAFSACAWGGSGPARGNASTQAFENVANLYEVQLADLTNADLQGPGRIQPAAETPPYGTALF